MKKLSLLSFLIISMFFNRVSQINAQSNDSKYETETIYLQGGNYVKNGVKYPLGYFRNKIKKELEVSPNAMIEFKKYKKNRNIFMPFYGIGVAAIVVGLNIDSDKDSARKALFYSGAGVALISFPFATKSVNSFNKAIWIRNGDVLR